MDFNPLTVVSAGGSLLVVGHPVCGELPTEKAPSALPQLSPIPQLPPLLPPLPLLPQLAWKDLWWQQWRHHSSDSRLAQWRQAVFGGERAGKSYSSSLGMLKHQGEQASTT